jgi:predicted choloylglycine hydrolase
MQIPENIRANHFKNFAEIILESLGKDYFSININMAAHVTNVRWETAKKYLKIMEENKIIKKLHTPSHNIVGYTLSPQPITQPRPIIKNGTTIGSIYPKTNCGIWLVEVGTITGSIIGQ